MQRRSTIVVKQAGLVVYETSIDALSNAKGRSDELESSDNAVLTSKNADDVGDRKSVV